MKSAREMFEELGFKLDEDDGPFLTYSKILSMDNTFEISFFKPKYETTLAFFNSVKSGKAFPRSALRAEEVKAVAKQMEEFGW